MNVDELEIGKQYLYHNGETSDQRNDQIVTLDYHNGRQARVKFSDGLGIDVEFDTIYPIGTFIPMPPKGASPLDTPTPPPMPEVRIEPQITTTNTANPVMNQPESGWVEVDTEVLDWLNTVAHNLSVTSALSTDKGLYELPDHIDITHNEQESGFRLSYDGDADKYVVMVKR